MGNKTVSAPKDSASTTVPRKIAPRTTVKRTPKVKQQCLKKVVTKASFVDMGPEVSVGEDERRQIQKSKNRFRHFVYTETSPAIHPAELVRKALTVVPRVYRVGTSYVLYAHDTSCAEECSHIRTPMGPGIHYHLLLRSAEPALETMMIKKTAASFVYIENSFYQVLVQCPITTYNDLCTRQNTTLIEKVGGEVFDMFDRVIQRGLLKPLTRVNNEPIWEAHKYSQVLAQDQLIALVNAGPYRSVMSQLLGVLVAEEGSVNFEQHGRRLSLDCGSTIYRCPCGGCASGLNHSSTNSTEYEYVEPQQDYDQSPPPIPEQVTYSTAGIMGPCDDGSYDYVAEYQPPHAMEYDLAEELLSEPTPEEALDAIIRSFSAPADDGIPKPSASSVDFQ